MAIPTIFSVYNNASIYNSFKNDRWQYQNLLNKGEDADKCVSCGQCEEACPQQLQIIETLRMAHEAFR